MRATLFKRTRMVQRVLHLGVSFTLILSRNMRNNFEEHLCKHN